MTKTLVPFAVLCALAAVPALAQQAPAQQPLAHGATLTNAQLAPIRDVLASSQQRLQDLGYHVSPTGHYDSDTRNAVALFQSDHGLRPTGEVDLSTIAALGLDIAPAGTSTAMVAPEPGQQTAMATAPAVETEQLAEVRRFRTAPAYDFPMLRFDDHDTAPQVRGQPNQLEVMGIPEQLVVSQTGRIPGVSPGLPTEDILR